MLQLYVSLDMDAKTEYSNEQAWLTAKVSPLTTIESAVSRACWSSSKVATQSEKCIIGKATHLGSEQIGTLTV